jgi:hypothetical protein
VGVEQHVALVVGVADEHGEAVADAGLRRCTGGGAWPLTAT